MSRTKRNLIIIGSIVGAFIVLAIVFGSLFSLKKINIDYATTKNRVNEYTKEEIIAKSNIKKGRNIVFAEYDETEKNLEKEFPYAKFNIVRVFPSTVIIYVYERTPVFRVLDNGFWYIFDEDLKCLEVVAGVNISLNKNDEIPILHCADLNMPESAGDFMNDDSLKEKIGKIIDGIYGFEATPISVVSDITLEYDNVLETEVVSFKMINSGTTINVQGENFLIEKIAYAINTYISKVSQDEKYMTHLDKIVITVYRNFTVEIPKVSVYDPTDN